MSLLSLVVVYFLCVLSAIQILRNYENIFCLMVNHVCFLKARVSDVASFSIIISSLNPFFALLSLMGNASPFRLNCQPHSSQKNFQVILARGHGPLSSAEYQSPRKKEAIKIRMPKAKQNASIIVTRIQCHCNVEYDRIQEGNGLSSFLPFLACIFCGAQLAICKCHIYRQKSTINNSSYVQETRHQSL